MKILIVGIYRTGSTSLLYGISKQGYTPIFEPYNTNHYISKKYKFPLQELYTQSNLVVKCLTDQTLSNLPAVDMYEKFSKYFDYTVLLSRRDKEDHLLSQLNALYQRGLGKSCHIPYVLDQKRLHSIFSTVFIENSLNHLEQQYRILKELSYRIKVPIVYYEDIYSGNIDTTKLLMSSIFPSSLDFTKLTAELDTGKRYRILSKTLI